MIVVAFGAGDGQRLPVEVAVQGNQSLGNQADPINNNNELSLLPMPEPSGAPPFREYTPVYPPFKKNRPKMPIGYKKRKHGGKSNQKSKSSTKELKETHFTANDPESVSPSGEKQTARNAKPSSTLSHYSQ